MPIDEKLSKEKEEDVLKEEIEVLEREIKLAILELEDLKEDLKELGLKEKLEEDIEEVEKFLNNAYEIAKLLKQW